MARGATYTFTFDKDKIKELKDNANKALLKMTTDIETKAKSNAPVGVYPPETGFVGGTLRDSIRKGVDGDGTHYVMAGGNFNGVSVPYALRREFENNLHPDKKKYLERAFNEVTENYDDYFKGVTK